MCGFVFVTSRNQKTKEIDADLMSHRGPDHSKEIDLGWCRLRHWRLSIQDLTSESDQPYSDQIDYLAYNGELYDFRNSSSSIFSKNFNSDTQLFFYALKRGAFELIKNLSGFYSFVFVNGERKRFFSGRDPFGKKPLYYYKDNDLLVLGSEDRAVKEVVRKYGKDITVKASSIAHYLCYKDLHFGETYYGNIYELAPGSSLEFDFVTWSLSMSKSWDAYYCSKPFYKTGKIKKVVQDGEENVFLQLKKNIINSIEKRFIADVPVQLALSGGIDSTLVALIAKHNGKYFERALTVSSNSRPSELIKSKQLCRKFRINQITIDFNKIKLLDVLRCAIHAQGAPLSHPHAIAVYEIAKEAANTGKVLITGEGADELFYGYEHYKNNESTFAFLKHIDIDEFFETNGNKFKELQWKKYLKNNNYRDLDVKTHLLSLLRRNDRISMSNSVELRSAYLDFELFQYVYQLQEYKSLVIGKHSLVKIIKELFEEYDVDGEKIGFYVPFDDWYESQKNNDKYLKYYIDTANSYLRSNLGWVIRPNVDVKGKLAWVLLNIGIFLTMEQ